MLIIDLSRSNKYFAKLSLLWPCLAWKESHSKSMNVACWLPYVLRCLCFSNNPMHVPVAMLRKLLDMSKAVPLPPTWCVTTLWQDCVASYSGPNFLFHGHRKLSVQEQVGQHFPSDALNIFRLMDGWLVIVHICKLGALWQQCKLTVDMRRRHTHDDIIKSYTHWSQKC